MKLLSLAFVLLASIPSFGQTARITQVENSLQEDKAFFLADSFKKYNLQQRMKFYNVPSVSIAVINNGKLEWAKAWGMADKAGSFKADVSTLYQAASLTKSLNAFFILKLVQDGKLSLHNDIRTYLKTWEFPDNQYSTGKTITLKNLLSHTAGLSTNGFMGYEKGKALPTLNQILDGEGPANNEALKPLQFPGAAFKYSGGGTVLTRKIVEDHVAANWDSLVTAVVLQPLQMNSSTFSQPLNERFKNVATAYNANGKEFGGKYFVYPEKAPDGLWTTPTDYAKFVISLQQSLKGRKALLTTELAKEMTRPVLSNSNAAPGVFVEKKGDDEYFFHTGANQGYRTAFYGSMNTGRGVIVFTNSDGGEALIHEIVNSVATVYKWNGFYHPKIQKSVVVADSVQSLYIGNYESEAPPVKISIYRKDGALYLFSRREEKIVFIDQNKFILLSSPDQVAELIADEKGRIKTLVLKDGDKIVFTAQKVK